VTLTQINNEMEFNPTKYDRACDIVRALRRGGSAYRKAEAMASQLKTWSPSDFEVGKDYGEGRPDSSRRLRMIQDYMAREVVGGANVLRKDDFQVWYSLVGSIGPNTLFGPSSFGIRVPVEWGRMRVDVSLHAGVNTKIAMSSMTSSVLNSSMTDRSAMHKATGWGVDVIRALGPSDVASLGNLLRSSAGGHCKFTRLVKGMLLYVDLLHYGPQTFNGQINEIFQYEALQVLNHFRMRDVSYSYSSKSEATHLVVMHLIGMQYPPTTGGLVGRGSVVIPPDAGRHYVVVNGRARPGAFNCALTAASVWTSLATYAVEMEVGHMMEEAMVTACSLYENRYFREVSLPRVESTIDLVRPAFTMSPRDDNQKPTMDSAAASMVGKLHQMCCFLAIKDMIIAAKHSTAGGQGFSMSFRTYMQSQETVAMRMAECTSPLSLLQRSREMRWMGCLNDADLLDLDGLSILEGLWLCDGETKGVERGGISCMVAGVRDTTARNGFLQLLTDEMGKAGVVLDLANMAHGHYSMQRRCLVDPQYDELKTISWESKTVGIVQACDYKPPTPSVRTRVRRTNFVPLEEPSRTTTPDRAQSGPSTSVPNSPQSKAAATPPLEPDKPSVPDKHMRKLSSPGLVGLKLPGILGTPAFEMKEVRNDTLGEEQHGMVIRDSADAESLRSTNHMPERASKKKFVRLSTEIQYAGPELDARLAQNAQSDGATEEDVAKAGAAFVGKVSNHWKVETIRAVLGSEAGREWLKDMGFTEGRLYMGLSNREFASLALDHDSVMDNLGVVLTTIADSRTRVPIKSLANIVQSGLLTRLVARDLAGGSSTDGSSLGLGDAYIADWMYRDHEMATQLSKISRGRLMRQYRSTPKERQDVTDAARH